MMKRVKIKTHTFFNLVTQRALYEKVGGYISKEFYIQEYIKILKAKYNLKRIYRFDLGQNNEGCSPAVEARIKTLSGNEDIRHYMKNYPEFICRDLRQKIAEHHNIEPEWILLSAGLDQMIGIIAATFLELKDRIMINSPSFYLFEEYSKRMGAVPIYLHLKEEDSFKWTKEIFDEYCQILKKLNPKLIWIANPNNPTGVSSPKILLKNIVEEASSNYAYVVIDEAYGEYIDYNGEVNSASSFLRNYKNLIVLRTFSKAYGLASLRVGYAMSSNEDILRALKIHRNYFPITQLSFDFASVALDNSDYIKTVHEQVAKRKKIFTEGSASIPHLSYVDTETNTLMMRHNDLNSNDLINALEKRGIIVAKVPGEEDIPRKYIRVTMGAEDEIRYFLEVLSEIKERRKKRK
jgi:histidinol-phosphate aminotransferase